MTATDHAEHPPVDEAAEAADASARAAEEVTSDAPDQAFHRTVEEGHARLSRTWPALLATGVVGGMDVGLGVMALLLVRHETGSELLGALAFSLGFIALTVANGELFTEDFLIPLSAVVAGRCRWTSVPRLWGGTLVANLIGGWVLMGLVIVGLPKLAPTATEVARFYDEAGIGARSFALAVLGGGVITFLTWMVHSTTSMPARIVAAAICGFLLAAGPLNHSIVGSLEMFTALHAGADFGYLRWLQLFGWAALGNIVGGIALVTTLRFVQVGRGPILGQRRLADADGLGADRGAARPASGVQQDP